MKLKMYSSAILLLFSIAVEIEAQTGIIEEIKNTLKETKQILAKDNCVIWGVDLYGPLMFVDPSTRKIYANEQDPANTLKEESGIFTGTLENKMNIANTTVNWKGKSWTMVMLPLPENENSKRVLIIHELFHNVQKRLGFLSNSPFPNHLEKKDARILLQLEWNALDAALKSDDNKKKYHIESALIFRNMRHSLYTGSVIGETGFEFAEGLPEYTGIKLGINNDIERVEYLENRLKGTIENSKSFVRSFAYISGPFYGLLLDKAGSEWRKELSKNNDLGDITALEYSIKHSIPSKDLFDKRKREYNFTDIEKAETKRDEENSRIIAQLKKKYFNSPVLELPNAGNNIQFNPSEVMAIENEGNYYPTMRVTSKWGILTVEKGAFLPSNWAFVSVAAPFTADGNIIKGEGWKLELDKGWKVIPKGESFTLEQIK